MTKVNTRKRGKGVDNVSEDRGIQVIERNRIYPGDVLAVLQTWPDAFVDCVITSPPYWGLRDYGSCSCGSGRFDLGQGDGTGGNLNYRKAQTFKETCPKCNGTGRIIGTENQLGLEKTPDEYIAKMTAVFREVRRVLKPSGSLWLNIGDSYASDFKGSGGPSEKQHSNAGSFYNGSQRLDHGLKPKDLCGIPWRLAFALQADGWVLRQEIIWAKKNPMPESVRDRCTKSHEQIFLFAKAEWKGPEKRQFDFISDQDARWLALFLDTEGNICAKRAKASGGNDHFGTQICFANTSRELLETAKQIIGRGAVLQRGGKNAPMYYYQLSNIQAADLLYRLYPHLIVKQRQAALGIYLQSIIAEGNQERRTKAGRARGRLRDDDYTTELIRIWATMKSLNHFGNPDLSWLPIPRYGHWDSAKYYYDAEAIKEKAITANLSGTRNRRSVWTVATHAFPEAHFATFPPALIEPMVKAGCPEGGLVLDPFAGACTTPLVAYQNRRDFIGIELNPEYIAMGMRRLENERKIERGY